MHPHPLAASTLILTLLAITFCYIPACAVWPFAACRKCAGRAATAPRPAAPGGTATAATAPAPGSAPAAASGTTSATCTRKATDDHRHRPPHPTRTSPADPDQPIPFTLTPKAHAALDQDGATPAAGLRDQPRPGAHLRANRRPAITDANQLDVQALCVAETGELAAPTAAGQAARRRHPAQLEDEVADVLIVTACFAERAGIDLNAAIAASSRHLQPRLARGRHHRAGPRRVGL